METTEIIKALPNLSIDDRLTIALNSIETEDNAKVDSQLERQLRIVANLAVADYTNDRELTIFTSLDGENFFE